MEEQQLVSWPAATGDVAGPGFEACRSLDPYEDEVQVAGRKDQQWGPGLWLCKESRLRQGATEQEFGLSEAAECKG